MTKPGDDKDACVTPHTASTLPGTPPRPRYAKLLCITSPCWLHRRPMRTPRHVPEHPEQIKVPYPPRPHCGSSPRSGWQATAMPPPASNAAGTHPLPCG